MKEFKEPEIMIKQLEVEDIITTSGDGEPAIVTFALGRNQTPFG